MTAEAYIALTSDDIGANKIFRAATASALDTNPVSIAQRGTGAPWLNGIGAITSLTSGSGNWTVPDGVYRIKVTAVGGGGGSSAGGNTTFGSITGNGGGTAAFSVSDTGGSASGGDINLHGGSGDIAISENPYPSNVYANGGTSCVGGGVGKGGSYVFSSSGATRTGPGGGGTAIKIFSVEPGDTIAYSVGSGGSGLGSTTAGTAGIIIIEY